MKIGVGIVTCDRPEFFTKCRDSIKDDTFDHIIVINDGFDEVVDPRSEVIKTSGREGVGKGKNKALKYLHGQGCDYFFLLEDDMIILDNRVFAKYIDSINGVHEFIPPGDCNKNAHVESFNSIIETEFFQVWYFETYAQAYKETYKFIQFYNEQRIHGSLNMMSPVEFTEKFSRGETQILDVSV